MKTLKKREEKSIKDEKVKRGMKRGGEIMIAKLKLIFFDSGDG
jgi:hypothetical protein